MREPGEALVGVPVGQIVGEHLEQEHRVIGGEAIGRRVSDAPRALELRDQRLDARAPVVGPGDVISVVGPVGEEYLDLP